MRLIRDMQVCAILFGILMLAIIFGVPETNYVRPHTVIRPPTTFDEESKAGVDMDEKIKGQHIETTAIPVHVTGNGGLDVEPKHTYWRSLRVFTGRYTDAPIWKIFVRPLIMFWYPGVLWAFLIYGTTLTW